MADKEYIERGRLIEDFRSCGADKGLVDAIIYRIHKHPLADVVEVRHGEWMKSKDDFYVCSECGTCCPYTPYFDHIEYWECRYCQHCGAKMDGKGEGE